MVTTLARRPLLTDGIDMRHNLEAYTMASFS